MPDKSFGPWPHIIPPRVDPTHVVTLHLQIRMDGHDHTSSLTLTFRYSMHKQTLLPETETFLHFFFNGESEIDVQLWRQNPPPSS